MRRDGSIQELKGAAIQEWSRRVCITFFSLTIWKIRRAIILTQALHGVRLITLCLSFCVQVGIKKDYWRKLVEISHLLESLVGCHYLGQSCGPFKVRKFYIIKALVLLSSAKKSRASSSCHSSCFLRSPVTKLQLVSFCDHNSSRVCLSINFYFKRHLLINCWANFKQISQECSFGGCSFYYH
jgi:hypothetical protein